MESEDPSIEPNATRINYTPRPQFLPFHLRSQRFACMVAHRRAGKTVSCVNELVARAIHSKKKRPRYAYIGPLLKQAKKIAWEYLKEYTQGLEAKKPSESELTVVLAHNGAEISIYGADNPDSFRGQYFDGVVLDEYGDMSPSVWGKTLLPTLADRKGWAVFIGTFKGKNHFYRVWRRSQGLDLDPEEDPEHFRKNWYSYTLRASESGILSKEELALQASEMDEEEYQQEYECNPNAAVKGTYYAKMIALLESKGQVNTARAQYDVEFPVEVFSDLGIGDSTALWFMQRRPDGYAMVNYHEADGQNLSYYYDFLHSQPYRYGRIHLPHDAKQRTLQTGRGTIELFLAHDKETPFKRFDRTDTSPLIRLCPRLDVQDGINAVRHILPSCWFAPEAIDGLEALRAYKREYNEDRGIFNDNPCHDWASHGSDAFRYFAVTAKGLKAPEPERQAVDLTPRMQLAPMFEDRERRLSTVRRRIQ